MNVENVVTQLEKLSRERDGMEAFIGEAVLTVDKYLDEQRDRPIAYRALIKSLRGSKSEKVQYFLEMTD